MLRSSKPLQPDSEANVTGAGHAGHLKARQADAILPALRAVVAITSKAMVGFGAVGNLLNPTGDGTASLPRFVDRLRPHYHHFA